MKVRLMHPDRGFTARTATIPFVDDVVQDLQLRPILDTMGGGDDTRRLVALAALMQPLTDPAVIRYRQEAVADVLRDPAPLRGLYEIAADALTVQRGIFMLPVHGQPGLMLHRDIRLLTGLAERIDRLRHACERAAPTYTSPAFQGLFTDVAAQLDEPFMAQLRLRLHELSFHDGMLMSARIGRAAQITGQVLRSPDETKRGILRRTPLQRPYTSFTIPERDEAGHTALAELRERSLIDVEAAATRSADHLMGFFRTLRDELGFYLGALTLYERLHDLGCSVVFPSIAPSPTLDADELVDMGLALRDGRPPVGNAVRFDTELLVITGANRGGKSTLLRAVGIAQLLAQAGLFVTATRATVGPVGRVFTHWAREEQGQLEHGKLDDELDRMRGIVDRIRGGDLLLCNESFSSTNEAEGSEIAHEITRALTADLVRVGHVTHFFDLAQRFDADPGMRARFLRAERGAGGDRPFRLIPGPALPTSYATDIYDEAFGTHFADAAAS